MALNVVSNLEALGIEDVDYMTNVTEIQKIRYIDNKSNQMIIRVDENDRCERCNLSGMDLKKYDAIIISDYCKGFLHEDDIKYICDTYDNVFVDTKKKLGKWLNSATYIKINDLEYKNSFETIDNISKEKLIITQGKNGCIYNV